MNKVKSLMLIIAAAVVAHGQAPAEPEPAAATPPGYDPTATATPAPAATAPGYDPAATAAPATAAPAPAAPAVYDPAPAPALAPPGYDPLAPAVPLHDPWFAADSAAIDAPEATAGVAADETAPAKPKKEKVQKEKPPKELAEPRSGYGKPFKFGVRAACINSYVPSLSVPVTKFDGARGAVVNETQANEMGSGFGFEAGAAADFRLYGPLSLNAGVNIAYRRPVVLDMFTVSELTVGIPVLARYILAGPLYADGGLQIDIPVWAGMNLKSGGSEDFKPDPSVHAGLALGVGVYILDKVSIDMRGVVGFMTFYEAWNDKPVYQFGIGASYLF